MNANEAHKLARNCAAKANHLVAASHVDPAVQLRSLTLMRVRDVSLQGVGTLDLTLEGFTDEVIETVAHQLTSMEYAVAYTHVLATAAATLKLNW